MIASQWISRLFSRSMPKEAALVVLGKTNSSNPLTPANVVADRRIQKSAAELDQSFFCWLLSCSSEELAQDSEALREKEMRVLKMLDQGHLALEQLPRRPASLPMLIKLLNDDESSHSEITKVLLTDPALTSQILKTANSPFFRISSDTIESVDQAVLVLGSRGVRNIVSATVMMPMMKRKNSREGELSEKAWQWALLSATASDQYSSRQGREPGALYLLGLLPSLAYLMIYRSLLAYQKDVPSLGEIEPAVVRSILSKRCWRVCQAISQQWGLPDTCKEYLLEAEGTGVRSEFRPLIDGVTLGRHKALEANSVSPLDDEQVFALTSAPNAIDLKVVNYLDRALGDTA